MQQPRIAAIVPLQNLQQALSIAATFEVVESQSTEMSGSKGNSVNKVSYEGSTKGKQEKKGNCW